MSVCTEEPAGLERKRKVTSKELQWLLVRRRRNREEQPKRVDFMFFGFMCLSLALS
jgi:hypothetical protein